MQKPPERPNATFRPFQQLQQISNPPPKCSCCPYGFHIDVGFLKSIEDPHKTSEPQRGRSSARSLVIQPTTINGSCFPSKECKAGDPFSMSMNQNLLSGLNRSFSGSAKHKYRSQSFITPTNGHSCLQSPQISARQPLSPTTNKLCSKTNIKISNRLQSACSNHQNDVKRKDTQLFRCVRPQEIPPSLSNSSPAYTSSENTNRLSSGSVDLQEIRRSPRKQEAQLRGSPRKQIESQPQVNRVLHRQHLLTSSLSPSSLMNNLHDHNQAFHNQLNTLESLKRKQTLGDKLKNMSPPCKYDEDNFPIKEISINSFDYKAVSQNSIKSNVPAERYSLKSSKKLVPTSIEDLHEISFQLKEILSRVNEMEGQAGLVPVLKRKIEKLTEENKRMSVLLEKKPLCSRCRAVLMEKNDVVEIENIELKNSEKALIENKSLNGFKKEIKSFKFISPKGEDEKELKIASLRRLGSLNGGGVGEFTSVEDNMVSEDLKTCLDKITQNMGKEEVEKVVHEEEIKPTIKPKNKIVSGTTKKIDSAKIKIPSSESPKNRIQESEEGISGHSRISRRTLSLFRSLPKSFTLDRDTNKSVVKYDKYIDSKRKSSKTKTDTNLDENVRVNKKKQLNEEKIENTSESFQESQVENYPDKQNSSPNTSMKEKRFSFKNLNEQPRMNRFINSTLDKFSLSFKTKQSQQAQTENKMAIAKESLCQISTEDVFKEINKKIPPKNHQSHAPNNQSEGTTQKEKSKHQIDTQKCHVEDKVTVPCPENKEFSMEGRLRRRKKKKMRSTSLTGCRDSRLNQLQRFISTEHKNDTAVLNGLPAAAEGSSRPPQRPVDSSDDESSSSFDEAMYDGRLGRITFATKPFKPTMF